jgi:hypothetical protein
MNYKNEIIKLNNEIITLKTFIKNLNEIITHLMNTESVNISKSKPLEIINNVKNDMKNDIKKRNNVRNNVRNIYKNKNSKISSYRRKSGFNMYCETVMAKLNYPNETIEEKKENYKQYARIWRNLSKQEKNKYLDIASKENNLNEFEDENIKEIIKQNNIRIDTIDNNLTSIQNILNKSLGI